MASDSLYRDVKDVSGVLVYSNSPIKGWNGWPDDVRPQIQKWNRSRKLSFRNESYFWFVFATGFNSFTLKCCWCQRFFNQTMACLFEDRWCCDDCIIRLARETEQELDP